MDPARRKRLRALRDAFARAHEAGMKGLASGNYDELGEAIRRERDIITEQKALVDDEQAKMPPQRSVSTRKRK